MNSRERVSAASMRKRTDRPPTSLRCTPEAWEMLRNHLGVKTNNEALDVLDIDLRWVSVPFIGPEGITASPLGSEGTDFWGCHTVKVENDFNAYFDFDYHPLLKAENVDDVENHKWPSLDWWDYSKINDAVEEANVKEPRSLMYFAGGTFETPWYIRGMERFMMDLYENPDIVEAICSHVEDYYYNRAVRVLEAADGKIDVIGSGGDIGGQEGMMISPDVWRKRIKKHTAGLITPFRERGLMTFYHSCGSLVPVINDLIEIGLNFLDPIQITAADMTPENLFGKFGDRLSFHGAIDEVELLPHATPDEVYKETTRIIDVLGKNSGFIVSPSHQVQGDTSPENIVAIFEAVKNYKY